jgi:hypothetical protein
VVGRFEPHGGYKEDFAVHAGPAQTAWDRAAFADEIRGDVNRILGVALAEETGGRPASGAWSYWFENDDLSVRLVVADPEGDGPLDRAPAYVLPVSRSADVETWQLAERLYDGLDALGRYLLIALEDEGMPVASNFDVGDDW